MARGGFEGITGGRFGSIEAGGFATATGGGFQQNTHYEVANDTKSSITVILYFTDSEWQRVQKILRDLEIKDAKNIVLIDGRSTNKPSASEA